jgi:hypothetical protein
VSEPAERSSNPELENPGLHRDSSAFVGCRFVEEDGTGDA